MEATISSSSSCARWFQDSIHATSTRRSWWEAERQAASSSRCSATPAWCLPPSRLVRVFLGQSVHGVARGVDPPHHVCQGSGRALGPAGQQVLQDGQLSVPFVSSGARRLLASESSTRAVSLGDAQGHQPVVQALQGFAAGPSSLTSSPA